MEDVFICEYDYVFPNIGLGCGIIHGVFNMKELLVVSLALLVWPVFGGNMSIIVPRYPLYFITPQTTISTTTTTTTYTTTTTINKGIPPEIITNHNNKQRNITYDQTYHNDTYCDPVFCGFFGFFNRVFEYG
jgi:hypothetical protein